MKFKVWDSIDKKFTQAKGQFCIGQNGTLYEACDFGGISKAGSRYTPVFFTGQIDNNKTELYDQDILSCTINWKKVNGLVFWNKSGSNWLVAFYDGVCLGLSDIVSFEGVEKIGTKFENPELVEGLPITQTSRSKTITLEELFKK